MQKQTNFKIYNKLSDRGVLKLYFEKFYQNVTSSDAMQIDAYLEEVNLRSLSSNQTESMSGPVTKQECLTALLKMSNNKSPGSDGFNVEFYKFFWMILMIFFYKAINFCMMPVFALIHNAKALSF